MRTRLALQAILETVLGSDKVYYQPPETIKIVYPCIIYELTEPKVRHANDEIYRYTDKYTVTFITKSAEPTDVLLRFRSVKLCKFTRHYIADNLHHYTFILYY